MKYRPESLVLPKKNHGTEKSDYFPQKGKSVRCVYCSVLVIPVLECGFIERCNRSISSCHIDSTVRLCNGGIPVYPLIVIPA
jgi:hypothetical protein